MRNGARGSKLESAFSLLTPKDKKLIEDFIASLGALSNGRVRKYRFYLGKMGRELSIPFEELASENLRRYVTSVNTSSYSDSTKRDVRLITKKFFKWLHNEEFVSWIKIGNVKGTVKPDDVLQDWELDKLRLACKNLRNKALIETIYEGAFRPHEFLGLRKSDIAFDDYGAVAHISKGKTGARRVRLINAAPLLANWIENHPLKSRDAPLWVDLSHGRNTNALKWTGLSKVLKKLKQDAMIEKNLQAYIFRHTRLTNLARVLTEAQLCEIAGWVQGSDMPAVYVHFSGRDVDDAILQMHGLKKPREEELKAPRRCVRCGTMCPPQEEFCHKCGMALSLQAALKKDDEISNVQEALKNLKEELQNLKSSLGRR